MISSFILHILAITFMFCDHLWATLLPQHEFLTWIGRISFPIFAFMITEGLYQTKDVKKYVKRLFITAIISEIPFNLMYDGSVIYPFHQNVLWTFLIAIGLIGLIKKATSKFIIYIYVPLIILIILLGYVIGTITMVDYYGEGILLVLIFYFFHGKVEKDDAGNVTIKRRWYHYLGQLLGMYYVNCVALATFYRTITISGREIEFYQQTLGMLALIPIWLYTGKQGHHGKIFRAVCYAFYPAHCLVLGLLAIY